MSGAALSVLAASLAIQPLSASAADFFWDGGTVNGGDPAADANGGAGTWNTTLTNWDSLAVGGANLAWINGDNNAIFGGAAGAVTLGGPITLGDLTFNVPDYTLSGNTLTFTGVDPTITLTGGGGNTNISSVIAGSNGLRINGGSTGRILFFNAANTFTGGLTLDSGRLVATAANSLGATGNAVTVNNGAALQINHSNAFGGDTSAANLILNNGANLWLGDQNLTHDVTLTGGTVRIDDPFNSGIASIWTGSAVLTADTTIQVLNTGNNTTFAGNLTDTGANRLSLLLNEGGGIDSTLFLTGTNSFTGGVTVNNGQLFATGADALGGAAGNVVTLNGGILRVRGNAFGGDTDASQLIINDGGVLRVDTNHTLNHDVTLTGGTANIDGLGNATWNGTAVLTANTLLNLGVGGHTLNVAGDLSDTGANVLSLQTVGSTVRFSGDLSFSGDFTIDGVNTWFDGGTHTYSGDTIITTDARLLLNSAGTLSPNSNFRFEGLNNAAHTTIIYGTGAVPLIDMANGVGGGELRWNGTGGFYALDAANGGVDIDVNLGGAGATLTWNDGLFVPDGHALILGTNQTNGNAREVDFQNGIDLSGGLRQVRADNGNLSDHAIISGDLIGAGGLQVLGDGGLELTGANTYSGATVIGDAASQTIGHLILGGAGALSANSNLQFNGFTDSDGVTDTGMVILTAASGDFTDSLGTGANQAQWTASGGFGAIGGARAVNLGGAGATVTWGAGGFVSDGDVLRFGGRFSNSAITFENGIDLGASDRTINANEGVGSGFGGAGDLEVNLNGMIAGDGGLVLVGAGDVALNALNTYAGTTYIGGVNVGGTSNQMVVWANTLADAGAASSLGAGATVVLASHVGGLIYTGAAAGSNRTLALNETSGGIHHLFNRGSGAITWTGDVTTTGSGFNTLRLGGTFVSTDGDGDGVADDPNVISGVISDGSGVTQIQGAGGNCAAGNVWRLTGANTFTGQFNPLGCTFEVTTLGNAGDAASVGAGDLIADYRSGNGTVRYVGTGESTDRSFWAWSDSHLESSGTGAIALTSTDIVVSQNGGFTHWLGGTNTGDNTLPATLVDSPTPTEFTNSWFRLGKEGPGLWALVTDNNAQPNAYAGMTRIFGGALRLDNAGAITGGLGVTSSHGATGSSERSSLIRFEGANDGTAGVLGLTDASGGFFRGLTTAADAFVNNNGTTIGVDPDGAGPLPAYGVEALDDDNYVQGVRWFGSGGFAAWDGVQVVNLFGDGRALTWGAGGFVPTNQQLVFGYETADGTVDFQNAVNLGGAARTILVNDGLAARDAVMSGVLSSTNALGGLTKIGEGTLTLTANNTYTGVTTISAGTLEVGDGGATGTLGGGAQVVVAAGATLAANRSNTYTLTQNIIGAGALVQQGTGTTILTDPASSIGDVDINAGALEIDGALETPTVSMLNGTTLQVDGTMQQAGATQTVITGSAGANTVRIGDGGTLLATANLGGGADLLEVAGTLDTGAGAFLLGGGADTFTLMENGSVSSLVDGGAGIDTFNPDIATSASLTQVINFETLTKTGAGVLNVDGPGTSDFSTINVNAGTLDVAAGAEVAAPLGGTIDAVVASGATLNVDGAFGCGANDDTLAIAGAVTGGGVIDQCGGDDLLTLRDGADVSGFPGAFDGGVHTAGLGDTVQLDIAGSLDFAQGAVVNYENLLKSNIGVATLSGAHDYSGGTTISGGTLDVDGSLTTPTIDLTNAAGDAALNVDGAVQAGGATQTMITGSAATNMVTVAAAGTLLATGDLGGGADMLDVAGALDTGGGVFALGDGADLFTIHDGTNVIGTVDGGAGLDTIMADIAGTADLGAVTGFEGLTKTNIGVLNVNGPQASALTQIDVQGGTVNVSATGSLTGVTMGNVDVGATLNIDGGYQGSAGADVLTIAGTFIASGTTGLGDGDDTLDVSGSMDLGTGLFTLGAGSDTFVIHDGTSINGAVDGGAGVDNFVTSIAGSADLGALSSFETLTKQNIGTLNINGPAVSDFQAVTVEGGVLNISATGAVIAPTGETLTTIVAAGATLNVDGNYGCGALDDSLTVAGAVTGGGTVNLCAGNDRLVLRDGADLSGFAGLIDGDVDSAGDTVELEAATAVTFNAGQVTNFEFLEKTGAGTATLAGAHNFAGGTSLLDGALDVVGALETSAMTMADNTRLTVDGVVEAAGGAPVAFAGGAGTNTILVNNGAVLRANGDLGGGADVLDVAGALDTGGGVFSLGDGDDRFTIHDGISITGAVDGGAGVDDFVADIATVADLGALNGFETLTKLNAGTLNINGPDASSFQTVSVARGVLNIAAGGAVTAPAGSPLDTTVAAGATLRVDGAYGCGASDDMLSVSGTIAGSGVIDLCAGDDILTLNDGATLDNTVIGGPNGAGDMVVLNNAMLMTFDASRTEAFERLVKRNAGDARLTGAQAYSVDARVEEGILSVNGVMTTPITQVLAAGTLGGGGTIIGDVANFGVVAPGNSIDSLLIVGDYAGAGGTLDIEAELTGTGSPADRLLITGDVTGTSLVTVIPLADNGAVTGDGPTDGISIIQAGGTSTAGAFLLDGGYVASGPYQLVLNSFDKPESAASELDPRLAGEGVGDFWDYRLQNLLDEMDEPVPVPQIPAYQGLPSGAFRFGAEMTGALHKRRGEVWHIYQRQTANGSKSVDVEFYLRSSGGGTDMTGKDGPDYYQDSWFVQFGGDGARVMDAAGSTLRNGLMFTYGRSTLEVADTTAEVDLEAKSLAFTSTYQAADGLYVDAIAHATRYDAEVTTAERGETAAPNGWGYGLSVEGGKQISLRDGMALEPQAQLSYQRVDFGRFTDVDRVRVDLQGGHSLAGRAGARFLKTYVVGGGGAAKLITPYVEANVVHEFLDGEALVASDVEFGTDLGGTRLLAGAGLNAQLGRKLAVYTNASWQEGLGRGSADAWTATLGFRLNY